VRDVLCVRRFTAVGGVGDRHHVVYAVPGSCSTGRGQQLHCGCAPAQHVLISCQGLLHAVVTSCYTASVGLCMQGWVHSYVCLLIPYHASLGGSPQH
jgi:hypothetical protein